MRAWDRSVDVVVMGSGSAALAAALTAAAGGAEVMVLEKAPVLGGTSAMSGAGTWIPANHHMLAAGYADSPEQALTYIRATAPPGWAAAEDRLWQAFVEHAPRMLDFVERHSPLRFRLIDHPDIYAELPGGKVMGRMLVPEMARLKTAGPWRRRIRKSVKPQIFDYDEIITGDAMIHPVRTVLRFWPRLLWRWLTGRVAMGNALIVGLVRGCVDHGCDIRTNAAVTELLVDEGDPAGAIVGVRATLDGRDQLIAARRGVVIASGGFEWDDEMLERHLCPAAIVLRGSPRTNTGDGQKLAARIGAALDRLDQANINPVLATRYEGQRHALPMGLVDAPAHAIIVDRHARRFAGEADRNLGLALVERAADTGELLHLPAWRIFDAQYARRHRFFMRLFDRPPPDHLRKAKTLAALAVLIGLDPHALAATVEEFNGFARAGRDAAFGRGETAFETAHAEPGAAPGRNPQLGTIEAPPFFAAPYHVGILGTKGGPRTNEHGQVLRPGGAVIPGLYCAGIAMANPIGSKNIGAGTTIGPNMTWGYICALDLLKRNR
jgi:3-oxosteroid 1-dehydrogenase